MRLWASLSAIGVVITSLPAPVRAATLPAHEPLTVLVIADEVNPNQLSDAELTQPGDFKAALEADDSGLSITSVTTVDSQCADDALDALTGATPPDVVLYFAHRAAKACAGESVQVELVTALTTDLQRSTGIVVLHHGLYPDLYQAGAKDSLLQLVGGSFEGIAWNTTVGQRVFNVGGEHFVATNGVSYAGNATFGGIASVAAGEYPYFDNVPDERYPNATLLTEPDEERTVLFASDSGGDRVLGYVLTRPTWQRRVVAYQPGEYQPNALGARDGNNFQILANALYFASRDAEAVVAPQPSTDPTSTEAPRTDSTSTTDTALPTDTASPTNTTAATDSSTLGGADGGVDSGPNASTSSVPTSAAHTSTSGAEQSRTGSPTTATPSLSVDTPSASTSAATNGSSDPGSSNSSVTHNSGCACEVGATRAKPAWGLVLLGVVGALGARSRRRSTPRRMDCAAAQFPPR